MTRRLPLPVFALARFNQDGTLDPRFGRRGLVTTAFKGGSAQASAVALVEQAKIVAVGTFSGPGDDFALARYNPDGTLDRRFGTRGLVTTDFAGGNDQASAVVPQQNGKIVVVGSAFTSGGIRDFALARYNPDGTLDPSFGSNGLVTTDFAGNTDFAFAVAIQPDEKIVAAGRAGPDFGLVRYK